jgi:hypothetical protein
MHTRRLMSAGALVLALGGLACAANSSRDPYGGAQDSTITAKIDSTRGDTLPHLGDTTRTAGDTTRTAR